MPAARQARLEVGRRRLDRRRPRASSRSERELGALEHVLRRLRRARLHDVAVDVDAGQALAQLREDVLGHDELPHALVAADAGVQLAEARRAR